MNLSAIHKTLIPWESLVQVVCDIGGYEFVSYSQEKRLEELTDLVVCDIGGYEFVSYSQVSTMDEDRHKVVCDIGGYEFVSYSQAQYLSVKEYDGCL